MYFISSAEDIKIQPYSSVNVYFEELMSIDNVSVVLQDEKGNSKMRRTSVCRQLNDFYYSKQILYHNKFPSCTKSPSPPMVMKC